MWQKLLCNLHSVFQLLYIYHLHTIQKTIFAFAMLASVAMVVQCSLLALKLACRLLAMCSIATAIKGAYYATIEPRGDFGAQYFSPVPLPVCSDINNMDYHSPEDLYAIMQATGSQFTGFL